MDKIVFRILAVVLFSVLVFRTIVNLGRLDDLQLIQIHTRRQYYPPVVARLFQNKLTSAFNIARKEVFTKVGFDRLYD
ncbi:hypothetical protein A3H89_00670 [Candidatus Amesbacteria bacterium RIFCSPLOWO2_02_FULL_48_11]|uniref:Uncharacterized protein n=5 Tax=Candidatus Amesiibacteriota TaxID=1752730 RepID=A0A1F4Z5Q8_9BACT|nr:MAG: hypothetical protein UX78_C0001G0052 [Candidatus Amesbacteria bacterium GW2011_GWA2_47_11]KKU95111.1 MAG: hypothetical protein UY22_C0001G0055 [Candidatus Amesbacteria bacterium GW2011_GWC1_48_10]KKW00193.1 MAG: hypothetical protein UY33_C0014G0004 [Candidatus Amesbacteria bacterium GW2011_GWA1_48_9]OGC90451.1 MAG: hypothetical protein A2V48_02410 [Candidatus Amesbacteria bacterium RBG_19FT_COMBO_48_16]OGC95918.1 MAG: hypothetical protein A3C34_01945 [Candidatus Amesbacteria bacterium R